MKGQRTEGSAFLFSPAFSPTVPSFFLPQRRLLFSVTVVGNVACCVSRSWRCFSLNVEGQEKFSAQFSVLTSLATFVLLLAWNSLFLLSRDGPKKQHFWASLWKKINLTHYISVIFFFWIWVLSHTTRPSLTALGNRLMTMETFFPFPPRSIWSLNAVFWVYWTRWVSSLFPLHPQVILVSEISVSFFSTSVCTCEQGNHGEGATCLGSHSESCGLCLC